MKKSNFTDEPIVGIVQESLSKGGTHGYAVPLRPAGVHSDLPCFPCAPAHKLHSQTRSALASSVSVSALMHPTPALSALGALSLLPVPASQGVFMRLFRLWSTGVCAAVLSLAAVAQAAAVSASGTVLGVDGKPLPGLVVRLALGNVSSTTDASGAWSLGTTPTVIASRVAIPVANGRLMLEDGRLSVGFEGRDVSGRGLGRPSSLPRSLMGAARAADVPDTLLYTWNGKVRLRDTISISQTGIVRTLDTNVNAGIVYGYLEDARDGQTYRAVKIGSQVWMAQNLNFKVDSSYCYDNDTANCTKFGRLYKWATAMGLNDSCNTKLCSSQVTAKRQGVCPSGWHVPSDAEWTKLTDTTLASATSGTLLKSTSGWSTNTGTDTYGFRALPGGYAGGASFYEFGVLSCLWSATTYTASYAWVRYMDEGYAIVIRYYNADTRGFSLRCLKD